MLYVVCNMYTYNTERKYTTNGTDIMNNKMTIECEREWNGNKQVLLNFARITVKNTTNIHSSTYSYEFHFEFTFFQLVLGIEEFFVYKEIQSC